MLRRSLQGYFVRRQFLASSVITAFIPIVNSFAPGMSEKIPKREEEGGIARQPIELRHDHGGLRPIKTSHRATYYAILNGRNG